jgi:FkbM family methyltransferase
MKEFHGYVWPDAATADVTRYIHHARDMTVALRHFKGRSVAVQAGGHCGIWPLWLTDHFEQVFTFEPEAANWECLQENIAPKAKQIFAVNACLGAQASKISLNINGRNTGGHKGTQLPGETLVVTIDGLALTACDFIMLDVEGMELPALKGAERTITRFHPCIMLEDRGHGARHGWGTFDQIVMFLTKHGYQERQRVSYDVVFVSNHA